MSDSPVGWGYKTMDGTGTGLERGGDPPDQDEAARQAESLLPCLYPGGKEGGCAKIGGIPCYKCSSRPAVAAALRERDQQIMLANKRMEGFCELLRLPLDASADDIDERIAALGAELEHVTSGEPCPDCGAGVIAGCYGCLLKEIRAENERLRKALMRIPHDCGGMRYCETCNHARVVLAKGKAE